MQLHRNIHQIIQHKQISDQLKIVHHHTSQKKFGQKMIKNIKAPRQTHIDKWQHKKLQYKGVFFISCMKWSEEMQVLLWWWLEASGLMVSCDWDLDMWEEVMWPSWGFNWFFGLVLPFNGTAGIGWWCY